MGSPWPLGFVGQAVRCVAPAGPRRSRLFDTALIDRVSAKTDRRRGRRRSQDVARCSPRAAAPSCTSSGVVPCRVFPTSWHKETPC
jgi:hypothetical protein